MNYIKEMRELIGNRPLMLVGTSIIAYIDGKILLQKRADNQLWGYPGGCMEIFETPEESAKREFTEETGYIEKRLSCLVFLQVKEDTILILMDMKYI